MVTGTLKIKVISRFLVQFYKSKAHEMIQPKCIIIGEKKISQRMKILLNYTLFEEKVFYLSIKGFDQETITKANINKASAIFYLSDQFSSCPDAEDKKALFVNYFLLNNNVKCNLYFLLCSTDLQSFIRLKMDDEEEFR